MVVSFFEKPLVRTPDEVADLMEQSLAGNDGAWDELISIPIADAHLDEIRKRCSRLASQAEISEVLSGFIKLLRTV